MTVLALACSSSSAFAAQFGFDLEIRKSSNFSEQFVYGIQYQPDNSPFRYSFDLFNTVFSLIGDVGFSTGAGISYLHPLNDNSNVNFYTGADLGLAYNSNNSYSALRAYPSALIGASLRSDPFSANFFEFKIGPSITLATSGNTYSGIGLNIAARVGTNFRF